MLSLPFLPLYSPPKKKKILDYILYFGLLDTTPDGWVPTDSWEANKSGASEGIRRIGAESIDSSIDDRGGLEENIGRSISISTMMVVRT